MALGLGPERESDSTHLRVIFIALSIVSAYGERARPVHLLAAASGGISDALTSPAGTCPSGA